MASVAVSPDTDVSVQLGDLVPQGVGEDIPEDAPRIRRTPREVFLRNLFINPFWEDSIEDLVNLMSPEHILFGSDYPHPEGMADPLHWAKEMGDLFPAADVRKMMGGNMFELLGLTHPGQ